MQKSKIKNLVVKRVLPITCALCVTGTYQQRIQKIEEPVSYDVIDDSGVFFEKALEWEEVTWDDVILTNRERGIKTFPSLFLENMLTQNIKLSNMRLSLEEQEIIKRMNVRNLAKTVFLSPLVTTEVENHTNYFLYVEETDDLNWEQLFTVLKTNLEKEQKKYQEYIDTAADEETKKFYEECMLEALSDEDLQNWVQEFHAFVLIIREDVQNIDMRRLACTLENYIVGYEHSNVFNLGAFAQTSPSKMTYPIQFGRYPNLSNFKQINYHEFYHLIGVPCPDEQSELGLLWGTGVSLKMKLKYDEEFLRKHNISCQKYATYFPFDYVFLEEGLAERYSCDILDMDPKIYFDHQFTIDNLELSLFLQPNFEKGNLHKAVMLHNPIAMIQQFPVLDGSSKIEEEWFYMQLEMLECYNIIHDPRHLVSFAFDAYENDSNSVDDIIATRIQVLENYADLQMFRNFIWTLINVENTERKNMTLEDCYYLLHLFESRLEMQRNVICINHGLETMDTESYLKEKENILQIFLNFLYRSQHISKLCTVGEYKDYDFETGHLSSAFSEEEKYYFNNLYVEMETYYKSTTGVNESNESIKTYYMIP